MRPGMVIEREFPILTSRIYGATLKSIPWNLIKPFEAQAKKNHGGQSLARLAERGGLSASEALAILEDREWHMMEIGEAETALRKRMDDYFFADFTLIDLKLGVPLRVWFKVIRSQTVERALSPGHSLVFKFEHQNYEFEISKCDVVDDGHRLELEAKYVKPLEGEPNDVEGNN